MITRRVSGYPECVDLHKYLPARWGEMMDPATEYELRHTASSLGFLLDDFVAHVATWDLGGKKKRASRALAYHVITLLEQCLEAMDQDPIFSDGSLALSAEKLSAMINSALGAQWVKDRPETPPIEVLQLRDTADNFAATLASSFRVDAAVSAVNQRLAAIDTGDDVNELSMNVLQIDSCLSSLACDSLRSGFSIGHVASRSLERFNSSLGHDPLLYLFRPLSAKTVRHFVVVWSAAQPSGFPSESDFIEVGDAVFWIAGGAAKDAFGLTEPREETPRMVQASVSALLDGPVATVEVTAPDFGAAAALAEAKVLDALALLKSSEHPWALEPRQLSANSRCIVGVYQRLPNQNWFTFGDRQWAHDCFGEPMAFDTSEARPVTEWVALVSRHEESWPRVQRALRAYLQATDSAYHEDRLLQHWVGIEQLLRHVPDVVGREDPLVSNVSRALAFDFVSRRLLRDVCRDMQRVSEYLSDEIHSAIWDATHGGFDYRALARHLGDIADGQVPPELQYRLLSLQPVYNDAASAKRYLQSIRKQIERDLYAVKRARNQLVHQGRAPQPVMVPHLAACIEAHFENLLLSTFWWLERVPQDPEFIVHKLALSYEQLLSELHQDELPDQLVLADTLF